MKKIIIKYKNGTEDIFEESELDSSTYTLKGHASNIINEWKSKFGVYKIDHYHAVNLEEVISIRIS